MNSYFSSISSAVAEEGCNSSDKPPFCSEGSKTLASFDPGDRLFSDRYRILKVLGQGGFGKTFLAVDQQQGSPSLCVVKQLFLHGSSSHQPTASQLFRQEVQRLAELGEHPQIPTLLDAYEQDGQAFIIQEWIDGWTLKQEGAGSDPFDELEIRNVLRELLPVLQYLHDHHIIHRDIKPANIICRNVVKPAAYHPAHHKYGASQIGHRQLVLVDFGAAKHLREGRSADLGTLIGSAEYAAPEQIRGHAVFASDLYSLGITCLYLLTQMSPFELYDMSEGEWQWQAYLTHPIGPSLKRILCKLLQPATRRRYQSAAEVLADLVLADLDAGSLMASNPQQLFNKQLFNKTIASALDSAIALNQPDAQNHLASSSAPASTTVSTRQILQPDHALSSAAVYLPETQGWYCLTPKLETSDVALTVALFLRPRMAVAANTPTVQNNLTPSRRNPSVLQLLSLWQGLVKSTAKDTVELMFSMMLLFLLTCLGSMTLICIFFELERRSPTLHPEMQPSLTSSPTTPIK